MNDRDGAAPAQNCLAEDNAGLYAIVEEHGRMLFGVGYLMTHDRGQAEDAVQETLVKAWQNLPKLRRNVSLKSWLVRIVINEIKQQYRKKRLPEVPLDLIKDMPSTHDIETSLIEDEEHRLLMQAIELLPQNQKEAVVLRYFADLSVSEVAKATGEREGTIKSRLSRALDRLEKLLNNADFL